MILLSCSLRWHDFRLLNSVCFIVSPQVFTGMSGFFFFMFTLVLHGYMWLWSQRPTSIISLHCVCFFEIRSLIKLEVTVGLACLPVSFRGTPVHFLSAEIRSLCPCIRLFCGFWSPNFRCTWCVASTSHLIRWANSLSSLEIRVFLQKRSHTCFTYLLGMVGWISKTPNTF